MAITSAICKWQKSVTLLVRSLFYFSSNSVLVWSQMLPFLLACCCRRRSPKNHSDFDGGEAQISQNTILVAAAPAAAESGGLKFISDYLLHKSLIFFWITICNIVTNIIQYLPFLLVLVSIDDGVEFRRSKKAVGGCCPLASVSVSGLTCGFFLFLDHWPAKITSFCSEWFWIHIPLSSFSSDLFCDFSTITQWDKVNRKIDNMDDYIPVQLYLVWP